MAIRRRLSSRRLVVLALLLGLIATISFWVTSNHGSAAVQGQLPQGIAQLPGDIVQVTSEDGRASRPALLETAAGRLIVFYHIDFNVDQEHGLFYRTSDDSGATWSAPSVLMVGSAFSPDLAQAADGTCGWYTLDVVRMSGLTFTTGPAPTMALPGLRRPFSQTSPKMNSRLPLSRQSYRSL